MNKREKEREERKRNKNRSIQKSSAIMSIG